MQVVEGLGNDRLIFLGRVRERIVALAEHAIKADRERGTEEGMDDCVSKPIRTSELSAAIAAAVKDTHTTGGPGGLGTLRLKDEPDMTPTSPGRSQS